MGPGFYHRIGRKERYLTTYRCHSIDYLYYLAPNHDGQANTLLADHLFSPALFLAERIERGLIPVHRRKGWLSYLCTNGYIFDLLDVFIVIELGAGCALPSLLMSTLWEPPSLVVVTDYPDDGILGNLKKNVERNHKLVASGCIVRSRGYEWGADVDPLM